MIIVISPSKKLEIKDHLTACEASTPVLINDTLELAKKLKTLSSADIAKLMGLSDALAQLNYERYQSFELKSTPKHAYRAASLYKGDVYDGLQATSLTKESLHYAQQHLRILSGLYGLLRPLDMIQPHRLEMGTKLSTTRGRHLYDFWGERITQELHLLLKKEKEPLLLNLASNEYFKSVVKKQIDAPIVTVHFKEEKKGSLKAIMPYVKRARGVMARYVIEQQIDNIEDIKSFDKEGYRFNKMHSSENELMFSRKTAI